MASQKRSYVVRLSRFLFVLLSLSVNKYGITGNNSINYHEGSCSHMAKIYFLNDRMSDMATKTAVTTVSNIAQTFLSFEPMTHKKLQKLCYYAYSWHLALYGDKLFDDRIEAWIHGPVAPSLYSEYKSHGWKDIPMVNSIPEEIIQEDLYEFIEEVFDSYGHLSGDDLEYLTHKEDPWLVARGGLPDSFPSNSRLDDGVIEQYFKKLFEEGQND